MIRLFVALEIPGEIREYIFEQLKKSLPEFDRFKWEKKEKIHLTLKFIGNVK
jgi:2'-5' RNA ligase